MTKKILRFSGRLMVALLPWVGIVYVTPLVGNAFLDACPVGFADNIPKATHGWLVGGVILLLLTLLILGGQLLGIGITGLRSWVEKLWRDS
jgi:hypothetical protein